MSELHRMKELVETLNSAAKAYYQQADEIMSNFEYDRLYDELLAIENSTGIIISDSPTQKVGYEVVSELPKERHGTKMLSLDKTKNIEDLRTWIKDQQAVLSWKLDGLTIVLTYQQGKLVKAITRGNGEIGEVVTNNASVFKNIPLRIPTNEEIIVRGEAVILYSDFEKVNKDLQIEDQYKNPRNLCSGTVRQLNNEITSIRNVHFYAFQLVQNQNTEIQDFKSDQLEYMKKLGFEVVDYVLVNLDNLEEQIKNYENKISDQDAGSDGLVLTFDSIGYSNTLGATSKFPKDAIAFKWKDQTKTTRLLEIEWSASRTGLINPVAIFEPVDLEGTTVARASVHNISILEELELGIGDEIEVYKANMIIPQILENHTRSNNLIIPKECPVCQEKTEIRQASQVKALICTNGDCPAKKIKLYSHFVSRDAMNIDGLSEATLEKLVTCNFIQSLADLYRLERYREQIIVMEGFGVKSYDNLIQSIEKSKLVHMANFIYALGIFNVGLSNAKLLCKHFNYQLEVIIQAKPTDLLEIAGFGEVIAFGITNFFENENNQRLVADLLGYICFEKEQIISETAVFTNKSFVITGDLEKYENRNALKAVIESLGGKVNGSVTSKTNYLINNDTTSTSSKNKKALELGIPIINEAEFSLMMEG